MKIKSFWKNKKRVLAIGTMSVLIILLLILGVVLVNKNKPIETMSDVDVYEENFDEVKLEDDLENQDIKSIDELEEVKEEVKEETIEDKEKPDNDESEGKLKKVESKEEIDYDDELFKKVEEKPKKNRAAKTKVEMVVELENEEKKTRKRRKVNI